MLVILAILPSSEFSDVASLDAYLDKGMYSNSDFISLFKNSFQCPNFVGRGGRYGISTVCSFLVTASASQCPSKSKPFVYCSSSCQGNMVALQSILMNSTICDANPNATVSTARTSILSPSAATGNIAQFCSALLTSPSAQNENCFLAVKKEQSNCGFLNADESVTYCTANPQDQCCSGPKKAPAEPLNLLNNTFVIAGIVAGAIVIVGIVFFVFQRYSRSQQRPTTSYEPSRQAKMQSTFGFFKRSEEAPHLPDERGHSSLFTTIRASQIFRGALPPPSAYDDDYSSRPYSRMESEYTSGDNYKVQIFEDYDAGMDDEISCGVGDIIIVQEKYDDGWASGINITTGEDGIFPLAISEPLGDSTRPDSGRVGRPRSGLSARSQSLLPSSRY